MGDLISRLLRQPVAMQLSPPSRLTQLCNVSSYPAPLPKAQRSLKGTRRASGVSEDPRIGGRHCYIPTILYLWPHITVHDHYLKKIISCSQPALGRENGLGSINCTKANTKTLFRHFSWSVLLEKLVVNLSAYSSSNPEEEGNNHTMAAAVICELHFCSYNSNSQSIFSSPLSPAN